MGIQRQRDRLAVAVARINTRGLFEQWFKMKCRCFQWPVSALLLSISMTVAAQPSCPTWHRWPQEAVRNLIPCDQGAVQRRIGQLCVRHEWRCGAGRFEDWLSQWLKQSAEPVRLEKRLGQLIFSGEHNGEAWALFWAIDARPSSGFVLLLSRLRVQPESKE